MSSPLPLLQERRGVSYAWLTHDDDDGDDADDDDDDDYDDDDEDDEEEKEQLSINIETIQTKF